MCNIATPTTNVLYTSNMRYDEEGCARYTLTDCLLVNSKPIKFYYELFLLFHLTHFIGLGDDETVYYRSFGCIYIFVGLKGLGTSAAYRFKSTFDVSFCRIWSINLSKIDFYECLGSQLVTF